jgi:hypothetical protein
VTAVLCVTANLVAERRYGSWLCENEIRFGRHAEWKTDFYVFLLSA